MFLAIDKSSIRILIINILYKTENCSFFKAVYKQTFFAQNKLSKFCGFFLFHYFKLKLEIVETLEKKYDLKKVEP